MQVRVIKPYYDKEASLAKREIGYEYSPSKKYGETLIERGFAEKTTEESYSPERKSKRRNEEVTAEEAETNYY